MKDITMTKLALTAVCIALSCVACSDPDIGDQSLDQQEDGVLSRLFGTLTDFFGQKAEEHHDFAPVEPWKRASPKVNTPPSAATSQ